MVSKLFGALFCIHLLFFIVFTRTREWLVIYNDRPCRLASLNFFHPGTTFHLNVISSIWSLVGHLLLHAISPAVLNKIAIDIYLDSQLIVKLILQFAFCYHSHAKNQGMYYALPKSN